MVQGQKTQARSRASSLLEGPDAKGAVKGDTMAITDFSRTWLHVPRSRQQDKRTSARARALSTPETVRLGEAIKPTWASSEPQLEPIQRPLPPPPPLRRPPSDKASYLGELNISGRLQQNPRKDLQADAVLERAEKLILTRADAPRGQRVGAINNLLSRMPNLLSLSLGLQLSPEELSHLALYLVPKLKVLDLRYNRCGDDGAKALPLECLPMLEELNLAGCDVTLAGVCGLRLGCSPLTELDLRSNHIDAASAAALLRNNAPFLQTIVVDAQTSLNAAGEPRAHL